MDLVLRGVGGAAEQTIQRRPIGTPTKRAVAYCFLASRLMMVWSAVPSGATTDVKTARISRMSSSKAVNAVNSNSSVPPELDLHVETAGTIGIYGVGS